MFKSLAASRPAYIYVIIYLNIIETNPIKMQQPLFYRYMQVLKKLIHKKLGNINYHDNDYLTK